MFNPDAPLVETVQSQRGLARLESMEIWTLSPRALRPVRGGARFEHWLQTLARLTEGALEVGEVEETWTGRSLFRWRRELVKVRFEANGAAFELEPELHDGLVPIDVLLGAANAALVAGELTEVGQLVTAEDGDTGDLIHIGWVDRDTRGLLERLGREPPPAPTYPVRVEGTPRAPGSTDAAPRNVERAWRPRLARGDGGGNPNVLGGIPWLADDADVPVCPRCSATALQALQLDVRSLPLGIALDALVQVYLCAGERAASCFADNSGYVVRVEQREVTADAHAGAPAHPTLAITGWEEIVDFADDPAGGDKCGGHTLSGRSCSRPGCDDGVLLLQLESSWDGLNIDMGDDARLSVFLCTAHDDPVASARIDRA